MKSRSVVGAAVIVVALIALLATLSLLSLTPSPAESTTTLTIAENEKQKAETIVDHTFQNIAEIELRDGEKIVRFQPGNKAMGSWTMIEPSLTGVDNKAVSIWANRFLTLRGRKLSVSDLEAPSDESEYAAAQKALENPRFQLTWHLKDGSSQSLFLSLAENRDDSCYANFAGEEELYVVNYIFPDLWRKPIDTISSQIILTPVYAITDFSFSRHRDNLTLEAKRISEEQADESEGAWDIEGTEKASNSTNSYASTQASSQLMNPVKEYTETKPAIPSLLATTSETTHLLPEPSFLELSAPDKPTKWRVLRPIQIQANNYALYSLILELTSVEALSYVEIGPKDLSIYGLDEPAFTFAVTGVDIDGQPFVEEVSFGNAAGSDRFFGWSSRLNAVFISRKLRLDYSELELIDLIERRPLQISLSTVSEINIETPTAQYLGQLQQQDGKIMYLFNGQNADLQSPDGYHYFKQLYRSINGIEAMGVDIKSPSELDIRYTFRIIYQAEAADDPETVELSLVARDESTYYIYVDDQYSGLYCSRDVLTGEKNHKYGILLTLEDLLNQLKEVNE